jgi:hypothetical protein
MASLRPRKSLAKRRLKTVLVNPGLPGGVLADPASPIAETARGLRRSPARFCLPIGSNSTDSVLHSSVGRTSRRLASPRRARFDPFSPSVGSWRVGARRGTSAAHRGSRRGRWRERASPPAKMGRMSRPNSPRRRGRGRRDEARPLSLGSHWRADGAPKAVFRSQQDALRAASGRELESGVTLNVYQCDFCSCWHLGSSAARER